MVVLQTVEREEHLNQLICPPTKKKKIEMIYLEAQFIEGALLLFSL